MQQRAGAPGIRAALPAPGPSVTAASASYSSASASGLCAHLLALAQAARSSMLLARAVRSCSAPVAISRCHRRRLLSGSGAAASSPDERLKAVLERLDCTALPPTPKPGGLYVPTVVHDNLLYVSGHIPYDAEGQGMPGLAVSDDDIPTTKLAAAHNALSVLSTVHATLGSLNRVRRLVKSLCMVNCSQEFGAHPTVMNGYSEVMEEVRCVARHWHACQCMQSLAASASSLLPQTR
jgi:enamine deaminase RidA (YjgF/YER057c/UK114 family)